MQYQQMYRHWLDVFQNDPAVMAELTAIAGDEKEIEDRFYTELSFGTAGMRGVLGAGANRMNQYVVRRATQGLADFIHKAGMAPMGVAIGYDSRRMSPEFALDTALTLCANGIHAYLFDALRPVALLSFAVRHLGAAAGVVITASHNPKQYNGYKVYWQDGGQLPPERADAVQKAIRALDFAPMTPMNRQEALDRGLLTYIGSEIDEAYYDMVLQLRIQPELGRRYGDTLKIVYTPLNGSGAVPVTQTLARAGFSDVSTVPEQTAPDPDFTTVGVPNPENKDAFALALRLADQKGADLVFATDPDCDRVGVAVNTGETYLLLTGNQIGCLLTHYIIEGLSEAGRLPKNGAIVKSIVSTDLARIIAESFGVASFDVLTGFKFIGEKIQQFLDTGSHTFLLGFEESFGYLSGCDVRDKDGVNAALLLAECALWHKRQGRTLYQGLCALYDRFGWGAEAVSSFVCTGADGAAQMARAMQRLRAETPADFGGKPVTRVRDYLNGWDGLPASNVLYYELGGGSWVCVRPSGTEPKIKLYVNVIAPTQEDSLRLLEQVRQGAGEMMQAALA